MVPSLKHILHFHSWKNRDLQMWRCSSKVKLCKWFSKGVDLRSHQENAQEPVLPYHQTVSLSDVSCFCGYVQLGKRVLWNQRDLILRPLDHFLSACLVTSKSHRFSCSYHLPTSEWHLKWLSSYKVGVATEVVIFVESVEMTNESDTWNITTAF